MTTLLILFTLGTFALLTWVLWKMTELNERQEELDKYSVHLDERANRLAANEKSCENLMREFNKMYLDFQRNDIYTATYTETDSDLMKYNTDTLMEAHAKKHLARIISQDIIKQFKVVETKTDDGKRRFSYRFKIVEQ